MQLTTIESSENSQKRKLKEEQNLYIEESELFLDIWNFNQVEDPVIRYLIEDDGSYSLQWTDYILPDEYITMENINILPAVLNSLVRSGQT